MKLDARRLTSFLANPGTARAALLYGEDHGLIRERADALTRAVAGSLDDPFRVVTLERDAWGTLADEAASLSMLGGRRVVRVRDATDLLARHAMPMLAQSSTAALVVIEAPELPARAKLRVAFETAPDAAAIACYPEDARSLSETIRAVLDASAIRADPDALAWLASHLGSDRALTKSELDKLALYAGSGATIGLEDTCAVIADCAGLGLEDALMAAAAGDTAAADRALELAIAEGAEPVGILRQALYLFVRLHRARLAHEAGETVEEAIRGLRPPVFFRDAPRITAAVRLWPAIRLAAAIVSLTEAEAACKRTGTPAATLVRGTVLMLARRAAARRADSSVPP